MQIWEFCAHRAPAGVGIDPVVDGERRPGDDPACL
jgi:hypothetical protein